jgi:hypothetical protein
MHFFSQVKETQGGPRGNWLSSVVAASVHDVELITLTSVSAHSMRCQSALNMAMFRCKKDIAIKYSRTLNEHFKSSSKVAQAPSPCIAR